MQLRHRRTRNFVVVVIWGGIALACLLLVAFWPHLAFVGRHFYSDSGGTRPGRLSIAPLTEADSPATPSTPAKIKEGLLSLDIPPAFVEVSDDTPHPEWRLFECGTARLRVQKPISNVQVRNDFLSHAEQQDIADRSYVALLIDIHAASPDDFRWTMSYAELGYLEWLLHMSRFHRVAGTNRLELFHGNGIDSLIHSINQEIVLEWFALDGAFIGSINLEGASCEGASAPDIIRDIARSLRWATENPDQVHPASGG